MLLSGNDIRPTVFSAIAVLLAIASAPSADELVQFDRDIRPIFANHCIKCHGRDEGRRKAGLALDAPDSAVRKLESGATAVVPGRPGRSELLVRVSATDKEIRMPPPEFGDRLSKQQVGLLRAWIEQGASYPRHWAFVKPTRSTPPQVNHDFIIRNPIDRFIFARLERAGLRPSPPARRMTLIRRAYFDLTGLPPSAEDVAQFEQDSIRDPEVAFRNLVDRLLSSPQYGERMAQDWLDAARYADTTGHAADVPRTMWLYRDWVIDALNDNMPFDQFTIEQLAGDMLPEATATQKIATGFHRNSMQALGNNPRKEEYRVKGIVDRLETTGRIWLGMTLACAECHDHKYDPISTKEYYRLYAIFNNIPHHGEQFGVHGPRIAVSPPRAKERIASLKRELQRMERAKRIVPKSQATQARDKLLRDCLRGWLQNPAVLVRRQNPLLHVSFRGQVRAHDRKGTAVPLAESSSRFTAAAFDVIGPRSGISAIGLKDRQAIFFPHSAVPKISGDFSIGMWVKTREPLADLVSKYDWKSGKRSYVFGIGGQADDGSEPGKLYAWVSEQAATFRGPIIYGSISVDDGQWHHVAVSYTAGKSIQLYVDGKLDAKADVKGPYPERVASAPLPLVIGGGFRNAEQPNAFFLRGELADVRVFDRPLTGKQLGGLAQPELQALDRWLAVDSGKPPDLAKKLYAEIQSSFPDGSQRLRDLRRQITELEQQQVTAQVMSELTERRSTHVHIRGNFEKLGERVEAGLPAVLPSLPSGAAANRLTFARWLVNGNHPLTARVIVNRYWQHIFGRGLVPTGDDFGVRGDPPSHPELLDWLAVEFVDSGWNVKSLHRLIVTSATYRQTSRATSERIARDPQNLLLSRGGRFRLSAEQIRDNGLAVSGLLDNQIGGPSVFPPQPEGVGQFRDATAGKWSTSTGTQRYRRGMYTFWQRMSPYPSLILFDAPSRERCCVRRSTTNTPLQALVTLNDPVFVEMARAFAKRILGEAGRADVGARIEFAFRLALGRRPDREELKRFTQFYTAQKNRAADAGDAESAAWTVLAQVLLNLDETLTRE